MRSASSWDSCRRHSALVNSPLSGEPPPTIPLALPSELLQRRPDIAAAERRVAGANAAIGVATAAFFPSVLLSASGRVSELAARGLVLVAEPVLVAGPSLAQTIFDGGRARAVARRGARGLRQTVAAYRQSVLERIQDVEDNLAALRILAEEAREHRMRRSRPPGSRPRLR